MICRISILFSLLVLGLAPKLSAQGTAFSYQGQMNVTGSPANDRYDFKFAVFDAVTNGFAISGWLTNSAVVVSNGLFSTTLDFGSGMFTGTNCWLGIAVKKTNEVAYTDLFPRQPILPVPYAIFANTASNLSGSLPATQLSGTVSSSQISGTYASAVAFTNGNNTFSGTFAGNGAGLASLNASQLASGTVADARLSSNVALLNTNQVFTGTNVFSGNNQFTGINLFTGANIITNPAGNKFYGSFYGNGNVAWNPFAGPTVQAEFNRGYLLTNSQLTTVTLPPTVASGEGTNIGYIVRISGAGSGGWRVAQNTNQSIYGNFLSGISSDWHLGSSASSGMSAIAASSDGLKMVAVAGSGGIYTSVDAGKNWSTINNNVMTCVASSADGVKLAVGNNAGATSSINLSTNSGIDWFLPTSLAKCRAIASSADGTRLVAVVYGGGVFLSSNSGINWVQVNTSPVNVNKNWTSVASSADGSHLAAVVTNGPIFTSTNYGINWTQQGALSSSNWTAICSSSDGSRLAATVYGGKIVASTDYGVTWTTLTNAPTANWSSLACSVDGSRLVAAVNSGGIYLSANQGAAWVKLSVADQSWTGIACSADCTKMAAVYTSPGNSGGIFYGQAYFQATATTTTTGTAGSIGGSQGSAVELQYIGNGKFMPVSSTGIMWAN